MGRSLITKFYTEYVKWLDTGYFDKSALIGDSNPLTQDEMVNLNTLLGELGCLDGSTQQNMTIYIDSVNGSDVTGDGSQTHPYASFAFLNTFPKNINHLIRILLLEDLDMGTDVLDLAFNCGINGCLSIAGYGEPLVVTTSSGAGPFAISGLNAYGAPPTDYGYEIQAAVGWAADELYGKWVRFETGPNAGEAYPVHLNDATHVWIRGGLEALPGIGDTFTIIEPRVTLSCQTINIAVDGLENIYAVTLNGSRFNLMNLNLDLRGTYNNTRNLVLNSKSDAQISFVTMISDATQDTPILLQSSLNRYRSIDNDIATYVHSLLHNLDGWPAQGSCCGMQHYNPDFPSPTMYTFNTIAMRGPHFIRCVETRGVVEVNKANLDLNLCGIGSLRGDGGSECKVSRVIISASNTNAFNLVYCSQWRIQRVVTTDQGNNLLWVTVGKVHLYPATIDITGFGYAFYTVYYNVGNAQVFVNTDPAGIICGSGALWFPGGVGLLGFPVADAMQTDNLGNTFSWIFTP